jgi:hypothetical protein
MRKHTTASSRISAWARTTQHRAQGRRLQPSDQGPRGARCREPADLGHALPIWHVQLISAILLVLVLLLPPPAALMLSKFSSLSSPHCALPYCLLECCLLLGVEVARRVLVKTRLPPIRDSPISSLNSTPTPAPAPNPLTQVSMPLAHAISLGTSD